ncbi:MAG TPA: hypothetical protein V6C81_22060 [Planktothrix sp.]
MNRRSSTNALLAALYCAVLPAAASDWVDGDTTMYRVRPQHPPPTYSEQPARRSQGDDGALTVSDPGSPGSPPDQHAPHTLEGNVLRTGLGPPPEPDPSLSVRTPTLAPPQTTIVPPKVYQAWLKQTHPELGIHNKNEVVDVKGQWDDSAHVLHSLGILCNKIGTSKLTSVSLDGTKLLIVDCAGNLNADELKVVGDFVHNGGWLITTDWSLDGCLTRAIPGYVMWNAGSTPAELVDARVVEPDSDLLRGAVRRAYWKLDNKCQTVRILRPDAVHVLVRSRQLTRDDPDQLGILALTFNYGKGRVLHLVGHFDNNDDRASNEALPDPAPGIGISLRQAIAANFAAGALEQPKEAETSDANASRQSYPGVPVDTDVESISKALQSASASLRVQSKGR